MGDVQLDGRIQVATVCASLPAGHDRLLDAGFGQAFGVADGQILRPSVRVVNEGISRVHHAGVQGLLERVERQVGAK